MTDETRNLYQLINTKFEARDVAQTVVDNQLRESFRELCGDILAVKAHLVALRNAHTHLTEALDHLRDRLDAHIELGH